MNFLQDAIDKNDSAKEELRPCESTKKCIFSDPKAYNKKVRHMNSKIPKAAMVSMTS